MTTTDVMLALVCAEITQSDVSNDTRDALNQYTPEMYEQLYQLSKKHDILQVVAGALVRNGLLKDAETAKQFRTGQLVAIYRWQKLDQAFTEITQVLEQEEIPYMPLKGSVIRDLYPEPWLRTSCDIDILVSKDDLSKAIDALVDKAGYKTDRKQQYHDVSLYSPAGVHLELHFHIKEEMDNIDGLLTMVWNYTVQDCARKFCYYQTNEFFMFHHIAHMAYHFLHGGCGVKPFIDLYIITRKMAYDEKAVRDFCKQCAIEDFYSHVLYLTEVWFGNESHTALSRQTEEYILNGGVYGTQENKELIRQSKQSNKWKYAVSRIWLSYDVLKTVYPVIVKQKWLFPFMQVRRWIEFVFSGKRKQSEQVLKDNCRASNEQVSAMTDFLNEIGL